MWKVLAISASSLLAVTSVVPFFLPSQKTVRHTKGLLFAGDLNLFLSVAFSWIFGLNKAGEVALWLVFLINGIWLVSEYLFWGIYDNPEQDYLTVQTIFGKKVILKKDITGVTERKFGGVLHLRNGRRIIADSVVYWDDLVAEIEGFLAEQNQNRFYVLPDIPERLFHGNLKNPWDFILLFFLLFILFTFMGCLPTMFFSRRIHLTATDCTALEFKSPAVSITDDGNISVFDTAEPMEYLCRNIKYIAQNEDISDIVAKMNRADQLTIAIPKVDLADRSPSMKYREIREICVNGETLISYQQTSAAQKEELSHIMIIPTCFLLLYAVYVLAFCYVVTNAQRFPRLVRVFFVKGDWLN